MNLNENQKKILKNLPNAVQNEALGKYQQLLSAVERYNQQVEPRPVSKFQTIWRKGNVRLLDMGLSMKQETEAYVLLIPSLINRYYILDLSERRSMVRFLRKQGIYPLVLDWGEPGEMETDYDMAAYVTEVVIPALAFIKETTGEAPHVLGYCLGGILALAAAQLVPASVASLGLLATPWDFASEDTLLPELQETQIKYIREQMLESSTLHPMILQWLFMLRQPFAFEQRFMKLNQMKEGSELEDFVQIEGWVNDNVPISSPAAVNFLIDWGIHNQLMLGGWRVAEKVIQPTKIKQPCLLAIPSQDQIVPTECAMALAKKLPNAELLKPKAGHVGMVVGRRAKSELWNPYADFVLRCST